MSLETDGYLSPDIKNWVTRHWAEHGSWFALADRLNRAAQRLMIACGSEIDACWEIHKGLIGEQKSSISP
jgi:hypothetical protein